MNIDYPFHFDSRGRTAETNDDDHIRDMIEEFLFTNPGERVNRPDFGSGLLQLVFAPNSPELAAALQVTIQAGLLREKPPLNGLDYLEVGEDQLTLSVYFLGKAPEHIGAANVRIEGGRRVRDVAVREVHVHRNPNLELDDRMEVTVDKRGDFSNYTLRLVNDPHNPEDHLLENFDARYTELYFSFKAGCPSNLDCKTFDVCPPEPRVEPEINYLAKDYASFRQLILDRLALVMPDWQERHVPDIGIVLVEVLAYVGDYLSYYQDAVGTEAYLGTARQRISVRRHARLVDYEMHEGCNARACNARAWICLSTNSDIVEPPLDANDLFFLALRDDGVLPAAAVLSREDIERVPASQYEIFEPIEKNPIPVYHAHNDIHFYTWGDRECCLPRGATRATLTFSMNAQSGGGPITDKQSGNGSASASAHSTSSTAWPYRSSTPCSIFVSRTA